MQLDASTGVITGTPGENDVGIFDNIVVRVSDGFNIVALDSITVTVFESVDTDGDTIRDFRERQDQADPTDPTDYFDMTAPELMAPADIILDATGLFTSVNTTTLLGLGVDATQTDIDNALGSLVSDNVDGNACCKLMSENLIDGDLILPPGAKELRWTATDFMGNTASVTQNVYVRPLVSIAKDSVTAKGANVNIRVLLNGSTPFYPLEIPYVIDIQSTASNSDHSLVNGSVTFTAGQTSAPIDFVIANDGEAESNEVLVVRLDDRTTESSDLAEGFNADIYDINNGARILHRLTIVSENLAP